MQGGDGQDTFVFAETVTGSFVAAMLIRTPLFSMKLLMVVLPSWVVQVMTPSTSQMERPAFQSLVELVKTSCLLRCCFAGSVDLESDADLFTLSVGASSTTILGGQNADTLVFSGQLTASSISGGDHNDSISISSEITSGNSIAGGSGADTLIFSAGVSQSLVSGDAGSDSISFNGLVSNSTLTGANDEYCDL